MKRKTFLFLLILIIFAFEANAQQKVSVKYWQHVRYDYPIGYNFFVGKDANTFKTTILGFGSGFIFDIFAGRYSADIITIGTQKINLSLGLGIAINKYRFSENLIFEKSNNQTIVFPDTDTNHNYVNKFFGYGKSKIVTGTLFAPINLNLNVDNFNLSFGILFDYYLMGKHKRKFYDQGQKHEIIIINEDFKNFNLNKEKIGISFMISQIPKNVSFGFTYMLTPFFQDGKGPAVNEVRISFKYTIKHRPFKPVYKGLQNKIKKKFEEKQV